jgi:sugar transferase (PEP-CTERM/EpsH1 system associated)
MSEILFIAHRIPFPPNRGDKMRSWNVIRHLGGLARVHLASFADDEADAAHLPALREAMGGSLGEALVRPMGHRPIAWAAQALLRRGPIGIAAFDRPEMHAFVKRILAERPIRAIYAYSVQMAQFVPLDWHGRFVMDFVDFDSVKYADYAASGLSAGTLVHRWEANRLFAWEKQVAERADVGLFVTEAESALFRARAASQKADIRTLPNGIDLVFYDPAADFAPLDRQGPLIVFTGQMDYRPNVEGVTAFVEEALPKIRAARPDMRFAIVGRRPSPAVAELANRDGVIVTGEVPDVRPWLAAASLVVAPLAIARGVQNKVLEAMAMGRPVVASTGAFVGIDAEPDRDLLVADGADAQAKAVLTLLADPDRAAALGFAARRRMVEGYSWDAQLAPLAAMLGLSERRAA